MPRVELPPWFYPFTKPARYKCAYGGRSASKTRTVALWLILQAYQCKIRVAVTREFKVTIDQSVKEALDWAIRKAGLEDHFVSTYSRITCPATGSMFFFAGVERNPDNVRGWEGVTHVWIDEAHRLSKEVAGVLLPTVMRGDVTPEVWFTWNPQERTDWVWQRFIVNPQPDDVIAHVNWTDNPWFPEAAVQQRMLEYEMDPGYATHVWEGVPRDGDAKTTVLPYSLLSPCMAAYKQGLHLKADSVLRDCGLDVADGGRDQNALARRDGPVLRYVDTWPTLEPGFHQPTAKTVHAAMLADGGLTRLSYDQGGIGSPIRRELFALADPLPYVLEGISFGGKVEGKDVEFDIYRTNDAAFAKRNIQMAWAVRIRCMNTIKLLKGHRVDPNACLFIPPDLDGLEDLLAQLAQPKWRDNPQSGKMELDKREGREESPDKFDAVCLAFARDSESGLMLPV